MTHGAHGAIVVVLVLIGVLYAWPFPYQRSLNNPNELVRVYTTMALVEHRTFAIDDYFARYGATMDVARAPDRRTGELRTYSVKGPGTSYLGVPVYAAFRAAARALHVYPADDAPAAAHDVWLRRTVWVLRLVTVQLPCFVFLAFFERVLRRFSGDPVLRIAVVVGLGVGTNFLAYALMFVSHSMVAVVAFGAWALLYLERRRDLAGERVRWGRLLLAGTLAGACTSFEYQGVICTGLLSIYVLTLVANRVRNLPRAIPFGAGVLLNVAGIMYFQWRCFGSPWTPGHKMSVAASSLAAHSKGLFGLTRPQPDALAAMLVDPGYGLFATAPLLGVGCLGLAIAMREPVDIGSRSPGPLLVPSLRGAFFVAFAICAVFIVVLSGMAGWRGGWTVGPRYLTPLPPFFALGAVVVGERLSAGSPGARATTRGVLTGLAAAGVVQLGVVGVLYNTLPEEITRPFSQVAASMIRGKFAPYTVGAWFGWVSWSAFTPVWVAFAGLGAWLLWPSRDEGRWWLRASIALVVGALASAPALLDADAPAARAARVYLLGGGHFEPIGYDEGTLLARRIEAREAARAGGPTAREAVRMCVLMIDQAQDNAARGWCERARALGASDVPSPP